MKIKFIIFSIIGILAFDLNAQKEGLTKNELQALQIAEDTLAVYAHAVMNSEIEDDRIYACHQMIPLLVKALKTPWSFKYQFPRLETIVMTYPADSTFRIFSWQLKVNEGEYRYFGAIQWAQKELKLVPLQDRSSIVDDPTAAVLSPSQWYGAVYYNMIQFDRNKYVLFGYHGNTFTERRKIIDVLVFQEGRPIFGAPVFVDKKNKINPKTRLIFEYSSDAAVRVNYDDTEKMIICDHLIKQAGHLPGQGETSVPDGSYIGYKLEQSKWIYVDEVFPSSKETQNALINKPKKKT